MDPPLPGEYYTLLLSRYFFTPYPTPAANNRLKPPSIGQSGQPGSVTWATAKKGTMLASTIKKAVKIQMLYLLFIILCNLLSEVAWSIYFATINGTATILLSGCMISNT